MTAVAELTRRFESERSGLPGDPGARTAAFRRFAEAGLPGRRSEDWRWASLERIEPALRSAPAAAAAGAAAHEAAQLFAPGVDGPRLLFVDGCFVPAQSSPGEVEVAPWTGGEIGVAHPLADLARAFGSAGVTLRLGPAHATGGAVQIVHLSTGGVAHLSHRIELADDAQAAVFETYAATGAQPSWTNVRVSAALAPGARLMRRTRHLCAGGLLTEAAFVHATRGASYASFALAEEGTARLEAHVDLAAAGAFAGVDGVLLGRGDETLEVLNRLTHSAPATTSQQTWRSVADDRATCAVTAGVEVARGAVKADARQSLRALLLKLTATARAKPELAIHADDVRCSHGATVGELDRDALFYLATRGVDPATARRLLTEAFVADALGLVGEEALHEHLLGCARDWLGART